MPIQFQIQGCNDQILEEKKILNKKLQFTYP